MGARLLKACFAFGHARERHDGTGDVGFPSERPDWGFGCRQHLGQGQFPGRAISYRERRSGGFAAPVGAPIHIR